MLSHTEKQRHPSLFIFIFWDKSLSRLPRLDLNLLYTSGKSPSVCTVCSWSVTKIRLRCLVLLSPQNHLLPCLHHHDDLYSPIPWAKINPLSLSVPCWVISNNPEKDNWQRESVLRSGVVDVRNPAWWILSLGRYEEESGEVWDSVGRV